MNNKILLSIAAALLFAACNDSSSSASENAEEQENSSSSIESSSSSDKAISSSSKKIESKDSSSSSASNSPKVSYATITDARDGKTYKTISIDTTTWMLESLKYNETYPEAIHIENGTYLYEVAAAMDSAKTGCVHYDNTGDIFYCGLPESFHGICPEGWHLPSFKEARAWDSLLQKNDEARTAFIVQNDTTGCEENELFWTTLDLGDAYFEGYCPGNKVQYSAAIEYAAQIRCVKGQGEDYIAPEPYIPPPSPQPFTGEYGELKDERDGKTYKTTVIGTQTWMAENLNYYVSDEESVCGKGDPECEKFGRHYTWDAAMEACPKGSHLPSASEIKALKNFVKNNWPPYSYPVSDLLRSPEDGWKDYPIDAFGFRALDDGAPYMCLDFDGQKICNFTASTAFWTTNVGAKVERNGSTTIDSTEAETLWLMDCCDDQGSFFPKTYWAPVRCILD